jgi:hypothetical protein
MILYHEDEAGLALATMHARAAIHSYVFLADGRTNPRVGARHYKTTGIPECIESTPTTRSVRAAK